MGDISSGDFKMEDLKIAQIDVFQVDLPYAHGAYILSKGRSYKSFDSTIVRITTQNGIEGWGEHVPFGADYIAAHALGVRAGIAEIAPKLIGLDPRRVDRINEVMDNTLVGHEHAKSALDFACWDIFGKAVGMPVCELLGGRTNESLPTICTLSVGTPDKIRQDVTRYRSEGFTAFSVKIGAEDPSVDAARVVAALADKKPGEFYLVDANGGMNVEGALRMLRLLPDGLDFVLEQPCATRRECNSLRRRTNVAMVYDELATNDASIVQMIADDAAEGFTMKIGRAGGLTKARRQRDMVLAAGWTISVMDPWMSEISFAAVVHLGQTIPSHSLHGVLDARKDNTFPTADGAFEAINGRVIAPSEPGLGITPRMNVLGKPVASYC